jgi:hypothetical protein
VRGGERLVSRCWGGGGGAKNGKLWWGEGKGRCRVPGAWWFEWPWLAAAAASRLYGEGIPLIGDGEDTGSK